MKWLLYKLSMRVTKYQYFVTYCGYNDLGVCVGRQFITSKCLITTQQHIEDVEKELGIAHSVSDCRVMSFQLLNKYRVKKEI